MAAATNLVRWGIRLGTWRWQRWRVQGKQRFESVRVFDFYTVWLFLFVDWTQEGSFIVVYCRSFSTASANIHQKKNLPAIRVNEPTRPWIHIQVRPNDRHKYSHSVRIRNRNSTPLYSQFYISPIVWDAIWTYMPICIIYIYISDMYNATVEPRFTHASDHEQFGLRTNFPNTKRLGWHTVSRVTNTQAVNIVER